MNKKRKIFKTVSGILSALIVGLFCTMEYYSQTIPSNFYINGNDKLEIASYPIIKETNSVESANVASLLYPQIEEVSLSLFGIIPIKTAEITRTEAPTLTVGGSPFGIKLLMDGVMVVKFSEVEVDGERICPAKNAGIIKGDIIKSINDISVSSNNDIQKIISESNGESLKVTINRDERQIITYLTPIWLSENNCYLGGMWVRDSIAGIGTITFIDKETGRFAGLGHPICDADTSEIIPISSGKAVPVEITKVVKGQSGVPGELNGCFISADDIGDLELNNRCGVYGTLSDLDNVLTSSQEYKMAYKQEIETGKAYIMSTVSGNTPEMYEIEIESIDYTSTEDTQNMVISITDERLLDKTGGIVQGMSGSPIIQNDKIVGAVTHVFVADSTKGYGIFAENMVQYMSN